MMPLEPGAYRVWVIHRAMFLLSLSENIRRRPPGFFLR